jgi:hypothetical protein
MVIGQEREDETLQCVNVNAHVQVYLVQCTSPKVSFSHHSRFARSVAVVFYRARESSSVCIVGIAGACVREGGREGVRAWVRTQWRVLFFCEVEGSICLGVRVRRERESE